MDKNRLQPGVDYKLDLQGRTKFSYDGPDKAKDPLFEYVSQEALNKDTYRGFIFCIILLNVYYFSPFSSSNYILSIFLHSLICLMSSA